MKIMINYDETRIPIDYFLEKPFITNEGTESLLFGKNELLAIRTEAIMFKEKLPSCGRRKTFLPKLSSVRLNHNGHNVSASRFRSAHNRKCPLTPGEFLSWW